LELCIIEILKKQDYFKFNSARIFLINTPSISASLLYKICYRELLFLISSIIVDFNSTKDELDKLSENLVS